MSRTALVIAARTPAELDQRTRTLEASGAAASCEKLDGDMCIAIPKAVAVHPLAESFKRGRSAGDFFLAHLDPQYAKLNLPVRVTFQNAEMTSYVVTESIIPGELRITKLSTSEAL